MDMKGADKGAEDEERDNYVTLRCRVWTPRLIQRLPCLADDMDQGAPETGQRTSRQLWDGIQSHGRTPWHNLTGLP